MVFRVDPNDNIVSIYVNFNSERFLNVENSITFTQNSTTFSCSLY